MRDRMYRGALGAAAAAAMVLGATSASADPQVAYNNFESGYLFSGSGWLLRGADQNPNLNELRIGFDFVAEESGGITRIMHGIVSLGGSPEDYNIQIREDANGLPGSVVGEWRSGAGLPYVIDADGSVELTAGDAYWIVAEPNVSTVWATWRQNNINDFGIRAASDGGGPWTLNSANRGAFQIEVDNDDIAYSNFDPTDFLFSGNGWIIQGTDGGSTNAFTQGFLFQPMVSGGIVEINLPLRHNSGVNDYSVVLYENDGGLPGSQIASWDVLGDEPIVTITDGGAVEIDQSEDYWLVAQPNDDSSRGTWRQAISDPGVRIFSINNGPWNTGSVNMAAFRIMVEDDFCIADWNGDGEVDVNDFFAYLGDFEAGDPRADLNNDGEIDINDFFIFLSEFEAGC